MPTVYLILAFVLNGIANICLKVSAFQGLDFSSFNPWFILSKNILFFVGLILFASNVIFYFLALRNMPISIAYPIMVAMSFLIINLYALMVIGESINIGQIVGYVLLIAGVSIVLFFKP